MAQRAISFDRLLRLCIDGVPITVNRHGADKFVYKIAGGSPEGDEGEGGDPPKEDPEGKGPGGDPKGEEDDDSGKEAEPVTRAELEAALRRMKAADTRASAAEKKVKELEGEKQTELEKAQARVKELEAENSTLASGTRETQIRNAFLSENAVTWHDPDLAFREVLASLGPDVELDDRGKVPGIKEKIKALAKEKTWMVKAESPNEPSGSNQNGKRKGEEDAKDRNALKQQYPALRR